MQNSLRIISGKWRSRRIKFPTESQIRPTPERIRETVFNWLQTYIAGSCCLDLFAGSGALGIEALSRGAVKVYFVEQNFKAVAKLQENLDMLKAKSFEVINSDCLQFIKKSKKKFDIIFMDPPFDRDLLNKSIDLLNKSAIIKPDTLICIESPRPKIDFADKLEILKSTKAGYSNVYLGNLCHI